MALYKVCGNDNLGNPINCIIRTTDGACIPINNDNTDYEAYLSWLADGNTPDPAN